MSLAECHTVVGTNLTTAFQLSQIAYPEMKWRVAARSSISAPWPPTWVARGTAYGPTKAGIMQLGRSCASDWAQASIQVDTILPGLIAGHQAGSLFKD